MAALQAELRKRIGAAKGLGRYRVLDQHSGPQGREICVDGRCYLNFSSNDYLGLANDPRVCAAASAAIEEFGFGAGAAALLSGRTAVHAALERELADFMGRECALIFSSGYLANIGTLSALIGRHDTVFHDRLNHASLIDGVLLSRVQHHRYRHCDMQHLSNQLESSSATRKWVLTDCVFSMDGDIAPMAAITDLCAAHAATPIGDDAHGFGCLADGRGTAGMFDLGQQALPVLMVTFGKALGAAGAAVLGSRELIDLLVQNCRTFIYDTAPPAPVMAAALAALRLIRRGAAGVDTLRSRIEYFRLTAAAAGVPLSQHATPIQPIMLGEVERANQAAETLRAAGVYCRAIRPPTVPPGTARLRVSLSAAHTEADIDKLVACLARIAHPVGGRTAVREANHP
jgi:8-amino-7-oxononanoate synthase